MGKTAVIVSRDVINVELIIAKLNPKSPLTLITKQVLENLRKYQMEDATEGRTKLELAHLKIAGDQICMNMRLQFDSDKMIAEVIN